MQWLIELLFGCSHANFSFPMTRRLGGGRITTRVCLDCGREKRYDWQAMKFVPFEAGEERKLRAPSYGASLL
jgi:hypothetical protein